VIQGDADETEAARKTGRHSGEGAVGLLREMSSWERAVEKETDVRESTGGKRRVGCAVDGNAEWELGVTTND